MANIVLFVGTIRQSIAYLNNTDNRNDHGFDKLTNTLSNIDAL